MLILLLVLFVQPAGVSKGSVANELLQQPSSNSFLIGINEAKELTNKTKQTVFIDIRPQSQFNEAHIPDSLNIAVHFIKSKTFLKTMHLILVNQGFVRASLIEGVSVLRERGFNAHILDGGLTAWKQHGEKLVGEQTSGQELYIVPAETVAYEPTNQLQPFYVATKNDSVLTMPFPASIDNSILMAAEDVDSFISAIQEKKKSSDRILVFNTDGNYEGIIEKLPHDLPTSVFFLEGGLNNYRRALEKIDAMHKPKEQRLKKTDTCSTCPSAPAPPQ
ncbi:MAG: rhodanese-like domain-containing protein [Proteobacteria bacterium]|nr:rhodanese-like domain-containing protein [Pseudomonadota bacterium]MBU1137449.1 rhodanese-like domain-containing protein [Pseudomonadota bacterium]